MIHEVLGINNNRVDLKHLSHLGEDMREVVLSCEDDTFFRDIMYQNFGEVAESIHKLVEKFLQSKSSHANFTSIEDMQRVIENFPEFKKGERNTTKHFNILEELRKVVDGTRLYDVSEVEQELVTGNENKSTHIKMVEGILNDQTGVSKMEKVRLALIFALRYEGDDKVFKIKELLKKQGISDSSLRLIDSILEYAGKSQRSNDLFQNKDNIAKAKKYFNSYFKEVKNVLLQHKPLVHSLVDSILKGKLNSYEYPATNAGPNFDQKDKFQNVIVFIMGGVTYEEAKVIASEFNTQENKVIIGGTHIHNFKTFLADISNIEP
jgi:vacuolar protein sorting-associated protein 45